MNLPGYGFSPKTKNPTYAIGDYGMEKYEHHRHSLWFWWPHEVFIPSSGDTILTGQAVFNISYRARQRFKILKERGWHNGGPDLEKKCFVFYKRTDNGNSPYKIAVKYHGDIILWVGKSSAQDDNKDEKFDMLLNMLDMVI